MAIVRAMLLRSMRAHYSLGRRFVSNDGYDHAITELNKMDLHMEDAPSQSEDLKKKNVFLFICAAIAKVVQEISSIPKTLSTYNDLDRQTYLNRIRHRDRISIAMIIIDRKSLYHLIKMIRERQLLCDSIHVSVEEQLMMFLHTIGYNQKNRVIGHNFRCFGETISRYFKKTLNAIASRKDELMSPPDVTIPDKIKNDFRFWPFFKDCIGAIDGTHVPARVPSSIVGRFRGRYQGPTQNIMAAIRFDLKISYILAGWEGSANDCTVLRNALERPNGLRVLEGKYFLVDASYFTNKGFISPYRSTRYYLKDFSEDNPPTNSKELFNLRHSSLRTTIERAFGVLKQRFKILTCYPHFPYPTQVALVLVCYILHNFLIGVSPRDRIVTIVERKQQSHSNPHARSTREQREENWQWAALRDQIADQMWERDYGSI